MDIKAIEYHVQGLLKAIGEDPEREGLKDTPARVARMLEEVLAGTAYSNHEIDADRLKEIMEACAAEAERLRMRGVVS